MPNRLADETSPYLRQHADNPVDWYPWGREALERARKEDRPILLSVGYAACHWCHVMAHESFEDPDTARLMNELFVNIKVDREERPDVDSVYMQAVQSMNGHGGWPMTVFLTPAGEPFYGARISLQWIARGCRRSPASALRVGCVSHEAGPRRHRRPRRCGHLTRPPARRCRRPARSAPPCSAGPTAVSPSASTARTADSRERQSFRRR